MRRHEEGARNSYAHSDYRAARFQVDASFVGLTASLPGDGLAGTMHYKNLRGGPQSKLLVDGASALVQSPDPHRGQVAALLDQTGDANDYLGIVNKYG
jgi:hypothetical protein